MKKASKEKKNIKNNDKKDQIEESKPHLGCGGCTLQGEYGSVDVFNNPYCGG
jgi:hypothetical protein